MMDIMVPNGNLFKGERSCPLPKSFSSYLSQNFFLLFASLLHLYFLFIFDSISLCLFVYKWMKLLRKCRINFEYQEKISCKVKFKLPFDGKCTCSFIRTWVYAMIALGQKVKKTTLKIYPPCNTFSVKMPWIYRLSMSSSIHNNNKSYVIA